jgi:hypothetical protein
MSEFNRGRVMKPPLKGDKGATLAEKREVSMWGLIIASGVCGLLFGRYFRVYSLIGAELLLAGIAYFLASQQGWAIGVLSFVLATVAIQICYLLSAGVSIFFDNVEPAKAPRRGSLTTPKPDQGKGRLIGGRFR